MSKSYELKTWLRDNLNEDLRIIESDDFAYDPDDECIFWTRSYLLSGPSFLKFSRLLGYKDNLDLKTISFLHELGHHEMWDEYSSIDWALDHLRDYLQNSNSMIPLRVRIILYQLLPLEYKATKWMVEYVNSYPNEAKELDLIFKSK